MQQYGISSLLSPVATAAEKKDIVKKRLQELMDLLDGKAKWDDA